MMETVISVIVSGHETVVDSFERAAELWDSATFRTGGLGGIRVVQREGGNVVRDGWLVHVRENGVVYVNPRGLAMV